MCPRDDSHLTLAFDDHYVIRPAIKFYYLNSNFSVNGINETANQVEAGFEYNSGSNPHFLTVGEISELNRRVDLV